MESHTIRQRIISLISEQALDARDLSQELGLKEKEVYEHLESVTDAVDYIGKMVRGIKVKQG